MQSVLISILGKIKLPDILEVECMRSQGEKNISLVQLLINILEEDLKKKGHEGDNLKT